MSFVLQLRSRLPAGGEPQRPSDEAVFPLLASRRILFLVHGYNNDAPDANKSFAAFESLQRELAGVPEGQDYALGWRVVHVYWAGDADWLIGKGLFYMKAVSNAKRTGEILGELVSHFGSAGNLDEVAFVSHSLGCRVVLETLQNMKSRAARARVMRTVFFAAAVPTFKLEHDDDGLALGAGAISEEWLSLFSEHDIVLGAAFPLGQTFASGNEGLLPTALGYTLWASPRTTAVLSQAENRGAGHGDYWGKNKTRNTKGRFASYCARTTLRLEPAALSRETHTRVAVVRSVEAREIAARKQETREVWLSSTYV
jgi:hypothetical protein